MAFFEWLNQIDTQFLLALNARNSSYFDQFFSLFTSKEIWFPLYIFLVFLLFKKYKLSGIWVVVFFILAIVIGDQLSGIFKDLIHRLRPSHEPLLMGKLNLPIGKRGSFGFFSAHATNSFALTFLLGFLTKSKRIWGAFLMWAILTSYSRIYVGVHYPFDVITGAIVGSFIGWGVFKLLILFDFRFQQKKITLSGAWNSSDLNKLLIALCFITVTLLVVAKLIQQ